MAILVSDICDEARLLLNDVGATLYSNTVLIPVVKKAYRECQQEIGNVGGPVVKEQTASITVPAGTTKIVFGATIPAPALPPTLLYPIQLEEKMLGEDDSRYIQMNEREWVPNTTQEQRMRYWTWIDDEIRLVGSTTDVPVRIRYYGSLAEISQATDPILILDSLTFLGARTAAIAALTIGNSPQKGEIIQADAEKALFKLLGMTIKNRQGVPVRRRKFKAFAWRPFWRT